ncbi:hypothetical protein LCGC14_0489960 [marine sediment metagenome]|uniref:YutG/PgpA domain-containing protein n=1 Tax=marine sediment metagenome TaxID=412755 RepID=A0A0F9VFM9_9ZZZZ
MKLLGKIMASGLGTGYLPVAPGTWGSAAVLAVYLMVAWARGGERLASGGERLALDLTVTMGAVAALSGVWCVLLGDFVERVWGGEDPGKCTLDEWAGQAVALLWLPLPATAGEFTGVVIVGVSAFLAFRVFDILKPPPARWAEKLPSGWGVLADDLVAGVYANAIVRLGVLAFFPAG